METIRTRVITAVILALTWVGIVLYLPGVVTIVSQPVWKPTVTSSGNGMSAVALTLGALRCSALDQR